MATKKKPAKKKPDAVEQASMDSFPASDAPGWTDSVIDIPNPEHPENHDHEKTAKP